MFDLYLFNTIVNTLWYLFTILFVLYKYTAFFSYIYNFVKFCGQLFSGISHIYKYIYNFRSNRFDIESQNNNVPVTLDGNVGNKTLYQKCKNYISKNYNYYYRKIFPNADIYNLPMTVPLVETNYSSSIQLDNNKEKEQKLFNQKMNELENSELELEQHNCYIKNNQNNGVNFKTYDYTPLETCSSLNDDVLFDKNFKTEYINSSGASGSFFKNKSVTINEELNVSYESKNDSDSDIEIDSVLDNELNSSNTIFYDL